MAKLQLRDLRGDDLFPILDLLGKLDVADKLPELAAEFSGGDAPVAPSMPRTPATKQVEKLWAEYDSDMEKYTRDRGLRIAAQLARLLLSNLGKVREDVRALLADLTDTDADTIKALGLAEYLGLVKDLAMHPDFREVFSSAVSSATAEDTDS